MNNQSLGTKILIWIEVVLAARILLFTAPVLINKCMEESWNAKMLGDWYILVVTIASLLFLVAGIASIIGIKAWKGIQFIVAAVTVAMTGGYISMLTNNQAAVGTSDVLPAVIAIVFAVFFGLAKPTKA